MQCQIPGNIRRIRKLFVSESKKKKVFLVIQHCLISLYNPTTKTYREWDITRPTEWILRIGYKDNYKHEIRIFTIYDNIERFATYIQTGM